jgi:hypothetical protein
MVTFSGNWGTEILSIIIYNEVTFDEHEKWTKEENIAICCWPVLMPFNTCAQLVSARLHPQKYGEP